MLLYGRLPSREELDNYRQCLAALRILPEPLKPLLEQLPISTHPMDVLRTGCSALGCFKPEGSWSDPREVANRLLAIFPAMLLYWYHYQRDVCRIETQTEEPSFAGHFLRLLGGVPPVELHRRALDVTMILYAEHELAASTFTARLVTSTRSDFYSAITAAIGALRGPLHGGANEAALELLQQFFDPDEAEQGVLDSLARKERIMGFGHPVYVHSDPRSEIIKLWAQELSDYAGDRRLFSIAERVEAVMRREKGLFPNLDFYTAVVYHLLGIPSTMFTPLFVCSRITGWAARHRAAGRWQNPSPSAKYVGPAPRPYPSLDERIESEYSAAALAEMGR